MRFEFHSYDDSVKPLAVHRDMSFDNEKAAKAAAGRLAKRNNGPVDLARVGETEWADRYVTTASPSAFHAAGFCFERLE